VKHKTLLLIILLILFVPPLSTANTSEPEKITPIADTFVDAYNATSTYGHRDYLEVSDYSNGLSIIAIMFDISKISHVLNASSEIKLRLYCFYVPSPHIVGVHWCVNNTWNEENLTFVSLGGFFKTDPGDVVKVNEDIWYEWKVTDFVRKAIEENYEKITFTLEVMPPSEGLAWFASKDQTSPEMRDYSLQLVFTYLEPQTNPLDIPTKVALGLTVTVVIVFLAYKFSNKQTRKKRRVRRKV
jgi:hypothetical protein